MCGWIIRLVLAAAWVVCPVGCLTRQEASYGIKTLELTDFSGYVDLEVKRQERKLRSKIGTSETRSQETIFEESLGLKVEGFVIHPNVLEFALGGVLGLVQERFQDLTDGRQRDTSHSGDLREFDLHALMFKKRTYPMSVSAQRRRGLVPRPFLPSLETTTTNYNFTWQNVSKKIPINFQVSHTDAKLSPLFIGTDPEQDGRQKSTELRFDTSYNFTDHHYLQFVYNRTAVEEEPFGLSYDVDEGTFIHQLEFGGVRRHRLRSELNFLDQRGTVNIERARWREDLRLKHSDTLQSLFQLEVLDRSYGNRSRDLPSVDEQSVYLSGSLRHQLFKSQTARLRLFLRRQEFRPDLEITRWGGQATINYRKTNRWGMLHADYGFLAEWNDTRGAEQATEVIEEGQTFQDPQPIRLGGRNIIVGSITVRSENRMTFYQRGRDFLVETVGDVVEIRRLPTGHIADGETVLVDYRFNLGGTFSLATLRHNFGIRQAFNFGLEPYYRFEWQDQSVSPADATSAVVEDITAHLVGVEYRRHSLRLFTEYEDRDSTVNPFTSWRMGASYSHRFKSGAETSLHTRWTDTRHGPPNDRDITLFTVEGRHRHPITGSLSFEGSVLYRNGEDSISDDTEGIDVSLSLEWFVRETEVRVSFEFSEFEDEHAWNDSSALFIHLRRGI